MEWYLKVFRQYADFRGRARRKEYWMFTLLNLLFLFGGILIFFVTSLLLDETTGILIAMIASFIYLIVTFIPSMAVTARRLHDTGKSAWLICLILVPFGSLIIFVFMCIDSDRGENKWGPNPKDIGNNTEIEQIGTFN